MQIPTLGSARANDKGEISSPEDALDDVADETLKFLTLAGSAAAAAVVSILNILRMTPTSDYATLTDSRAVSCMANNQTTLSKWRFGFILIYS